MALFPLFVLAIRQSNRGIFKLLNTRAIVFVGIMSYSIYISHNVIIWYLRENLAWGHRTRGVFYLVIIVLMAWIMLRFIERPCAGVRKRFVRATGPQGLREAGQGRRRCRVRDARTVAPERSRGGVALDRSSGSVGVQVE